MTATIKRHVSSAGNIPTGQAFGNIEVTPIAVAALLAAFSSPAFQFLAYQLVLTRAFQELAWQEGPPLDGGYDAPVPAVQRFGVSTGFPISYWSTAQRNAYYVAIAAAGFTRVRFDYVNATPGQLCDLHVQSAIAAGLEVRLGIGGSPADSGAAYAARCTTCVNYFKTWVSEYELMNEPNLQAWTGAAYAAVASAGSAAVRTAMPSADVVIGGISNFGVHGQTQDGVPDIWLASVYSFGSASWFDAVDFHPYGFSTSASGATMMTNASGWPMLDWLRSVMVINGDSAKKIHVSEHGAPTFLAADWPSGSAESVSPQAQADFLELSITDWRSRSYFGDFYLYSFRDRYPDEHTGNKEGHFGIILNDNATPGSDTHKLAYDVVVAAIA